MGLAAGIIMATIITTHIAKVIQRMLILHPLTIGIAMPGIDGMPVPVPAGSHIK
jgi:ABC-type uncharacterized transport system permease subunit